jgi:hypothetical protein
MLKHLLPLATLAAVITFSNPSFSQVACPPAKVLVVDADSGRPIGGATVIDTASGDVIVTEADGTGSFATAVGDDGAFIFEVAAQGYPWNYRAYDLGGASTIGGAGGSTCTVEGSRIATLYLDAAEEMLSSPIGAAGGDVHFQKVTGQTVEGQAFLQGVSITVPPGAWSERYRIALSLPAPEAFTTAYLPEMVVSGGVAGVTRYPFAQIRVELQDLSGQPVDLGALHMPLHVELSSGRGDAVFVDGQIESVQLFEESSKTWSAGGAQVTGFNSSKKAVEFDVIQMGTYSISPLLGLTPKAVLFCHWKSMGSLPIVCGGGSSQVITTRQVAADPCGVLFDNNPAQVDQEITTTVASSTDADLAFKVSDALLSGGFSFKETESNSDVYSKHIKESRSLNPDVVAGKSGTATLFVAGRTYAWGLFCEGDQVPAAMSYFNFYSGTCWDTSELVPCN